MWVRCVFILSHNEADEHRCDRQNSERPSSRGSCSMASTDTFRVGVLFVPMFMWVVANSLVRIMYLFCIVP